MNDQRSTTYFTVRQAADLFKVSPQTIRRAIKAGRLEAVWLGPQTVRVRVPSQEDAGQQSSSRRC